MTLEELLYEAGIIEVRGSLSKVVEQLQTDSRKVSVGCCFIAISGTRIDGHQFIENAIRAGADSVVCERFPPELPDTVTFVQVKDSATAAGIMSHHFFGRPSERLRLVGVTGTNGKTTIATLLWKLFTEMDYRCGLVSTVQYHIAGERIPSTHTTPDAISINRLLADMLAAGCTHAFMECSSHAIHQQRIAGLRFCGAVFSNITHDHLDYHKTFDEYIRVKKSWFDGLPANAFAISNADDKRGRVMLQNTAARKYCYSLKSMAEFRGKILENTISGLHMVIDGQEVFFRLIGEFNASNIMAVYAAAICLGAEKQPVLQLLSGLTGAEGRFDTLISGKEQIMGIVDYAHTPDALLNVLATIRKLRKDDTKVITVVGCGGDRDKTKRPLMAEVACAYSDRVILTSDNPRTEDPLVILKDMEAGVDTLSRKKYLMIPDRREAIKVAVSLAEKEDILLLAGKGHEKYQEINGVRHVFDDHEVLKEMLALLDK